MEHDWLESMSAIWNGDFLISRKRKFQLECCFHALRHYTYVFNMERHAYAYACVCTPMQNRNVHGFVRSEQNKKTLWLSQFRNLLFCVLLFKCNPKEHDKVHNIPWKYSLSLACVTLLSCLMECQVLGALHSWAIPLAWEEPLLLCCHRVKLAELTLEFHCCLWEWNLPWNLPFH